MKEDKAEKALISLNTLILELYHGKIINGRQQSKAQSDIQRLKVEINDLRKKYSKGLHEEAEAIVNKRMPEITKKVTDDLTSDMETWSDATNAVTFMMGLLDEYDLDGEEVIKVFENSNDYVQKVNKGEITMNALMDKLEKEHGIFFDDNMKQVVNYYTDQELPKEHKTVERKTSYSSFPNLLKYIEDHGMSLREFDKKCGFPIGKTAKILNSKNPNLQMNTINKILEVTGYSYAGAFKTAL